MSAGTHETTPRSGNRWFMWTCGGAAAAMVAGGLMMQYLRAPAGQAASETPAGSARVGNAKKPEVLAKVDRETITYDAVAEECVARHGKEVLEDLIHRLVIQQACEKNQVTVTEQEVSQEIATIAKRFNLDVGQWMQMLQAERNITPTQYRSSVIWPMLALKKLAGENIEISEEEMKKAFIREYGPRVKARVIMFDNQRRAQECWEQAAANPDDFEKLAQKYSIDPNSRALGGQVPPIPRYTGNEELEKAAFKLKEGEMSGIVQLGTGRYVILKSEGRTEPVVKDMDEVRDSLYDQIKEAKTQEAVGKVFEQIKKDTRVDNYLTGMASGPERVVPGAGQIQPVGATQSGRQTVAPAGRQALSTPAGTTKPSRN